MIEMRTWVPLSMLRHLLLIKIIIFLRIIQERPEHSQIPLFIDTFGQFNDTFHLLRLRGEKNDVHVSFDECTELFQGGEKRGKSWVILMDYAKLAFFLMQDM